MLIPPDKRVSQRAGVRGFRAANPYYFSALNAGPPGSATMTLVCVWTPLRTNPVQGCLFTRALMSVAKGFYMNLGAGGIMVNGLGNGAFTNVSHPALATSDFGTPVIWVLSLAGGAASTRTNKTVGADLGFACVGYVPADNTTYTMIGNSNALSIPAIHSMIHDCAMFDTYAGTGFVSAVYGNGLAGLIALWSEDLQQGRYLTKPQGGALGANDWYWSARDAACGIGQARTTWVDRGTNACPLTMSGTLQSGSTPMVL